MQQLLQMFLTESRISFIAFLCYFLNGWQYTVAETALHSKDLERINSALASDSPATPAKPRKLLVFSNKPNDANIRLARTALGLMGKKTGAFEVGFSSRPVAFSSQQLQNIDAILFLDCAHLNETIRLRSLRKNIRQFVTEGGGLIGTHRTLEALDGTDAGRIPPPDIHKESLKPFDEKTGDGEELDDLLKDLAEEDDDEATIEELAEATLVTPWPELNQIFGAKLEDQERKRGRAWGIYIDEPEHPLNRSFKTNTLETKGVLFKNTFLLNDGLFRFTNFSREDSRALLSLNLSYREGRLVTNDFPVSWIRRVGKGRVFYSGFGHNREVFWNAEILRHWLAGIQYALGDLDVPDEPVSERRKQSIVYNDPEVRFQSPEGTLKSFELPPGYRIGLVASEPQIHEPVLAVWDGNGRMYVAEFRTYMQDADGGRKQFEPISRVSMHEDTDGDGHMDRHSIFADDLVLPRMVLPLDEWILIAETNTKDIYAYRDTDGDGTADEKKVWFEGGRRGGNLEHQPSGLIWALDNWIYMSKESTRYRYTRGKVETDQFRGESGQWGLSQDDMGHIYFSDNGNPAKGFQQPPVYGGFRVGADRTHNFHEVFPIIRTPDIQPGLGILRDDGKLSRFTSACGQSIFRGDRLPSNTQGNLFACEPVARIVRRAKVDITDGKRVLSAFYDQKEFLASNDVHFRPVNTTTGPDGCLYVIDMYRGIIQEGSWTGKGSYLRSAIKRMGLDKNIQRGRIYRIVHDDHKPGPRPHMLDEKPAELVRHLSNPNGWWRDTAKKLLILRGDRSVIPALKELARNGKTPLGRVHALWTLEGFDVVDRELLIEKLKDENPRVRITAIRIGELLLAKGDETFISVLKLLAEDGDLSVLTQLFLSLSSTEKNEALKLAAAIKNKHPDSEVIKVAFNSQRYRRQEIQRRKQLRASNARLADAIERGQGLYEATCITCHGSDGRGMPVLGGIEGETRAPPLAGSERVRGHPDVLIRIILHAVTGPIDDKEYEEHMVPMAALDNDSLSLVINYVRNSWGNSASIIEPDNIATVRKETEGREKPWTLKELAAYLPKPLPRDDWIVTASHNPDKAPMAIDNDAGSRFDTGKPQKPGMWFMIEFPKTTTVGSILLDSSRSRDDYPRGYKVEASDDGESWSKPLATGLGRKGMTEINFQKVRTKYIRITQTVQTSNKFWSIHELHMLGFEDEE